MKIDKYRWTREEKLVILDQLLTDQLEQETPATPTLVKLPATLDQAEKQILQGDSIAGITTGYKSLDNMTRGLAEGEVSVVFGYTSHGKSQLTQNIAYNVAARGIPVLLLPLEMTAAQNTARFLSFADRDKLMALPIYYPASKQIRHKDLNALVGAAKDQGVKLVVIDQLQQLTRSVENQTNEISLITHTISEVAKVHDVHIMLISHVSRSGFGKAPDLVDLKGSSSIEQDADICLSVWRNFKAEDEYERNALVVHLRKNRNRGMAATKATLEVKDGVRLVESTVDTIFPF